MKTGMLKAKRKTIDHFTKGNASSRRLKFAAAFVGVCCVVTLAMGPLALAQAPNWMLPLGAKVTTQEANEDAFSSESETTSSSNYTLPLGNAVADFGSTKSGICEPTALAAGPGGPITHCERPAARAVGSPKNPLRRCPTAGRHFSASPL